MNGIKKRLTIFVTVLAIIGLSAGIDLSAQEEKAVDKPFVLVIHGGAGNMSPDSIPPKKQKAYIKQLKKALTTGSGILAKGGKSLDAVEAAIRIMEDSPLFNAGKGAVFTAEGTNELDASIMDGKTLNAGAAAGVKHVKNPIRLARMIMERSSHVMLSGEGAEVFAKKMGVPLAPARYFHTKPRWESLQRAKEKEAGEKVDEKNKKFGTVGAVALDKDGNLAAGTSTGGMTNKRFGRIGDSPIIGAGTYANNRTCAVSATGYGEFFIRSVVAHDISALMEYKGSPLEKAAEAVLQKVKDLGGYGGVIAVDHSGNIAMPFNTSGMFRGFVKNDGEITIKIFKD